MPRSQSPSLPVESESDLKLAWITRRGKPKRLCRSSVDPTPKAEIGQRSRPGRARHGQSVRPDTGSTNHIVDSRKIRPVEEIESLHRHLEETALPDKETPCQSQVERVARLSPSRISPGTPRTVTLRAGIVSSTATESEVLSTAIARAESLSGKEPATLAAIKRGLYASTLRHLESD
jgi:hypothetical protein